MPVLLQNSGADRLEIGFKPFLPPGVTDWADEDGATPSYNNVGGNPDQWYDLPIRYLQELYPAEDMLTEALGIQRAHMGYLCCTDISEPCRMKHIKVIIRSTRKWRML